jgi:hypothetical protein
MKIIKKISKSNKQRFADAVADSIQYVLGEDKELSKIENILYDQDYSYNGWPDKVETLSKEDKKELEHFLLMLSNRTKRRALQKLKGLR